MLFACLFNFLLYKIMLIVCIWNSWIKAIKYKKKWLRYSIALWARRCSRNEQHKLTGCLKYVYCRQIFILGPDPEWILNTDIHKKLGSHNGSLTQSTQHSENIKILINHYDKAKKITIGLSYKHCRFQGMKFQTKENVVQCSGLFIWICCWR